VKQAAELFLAREEKRLAIQSFLQRKTHVDKHIVPSFGDIAIAALTWQRVEENAATWKVSAKTVGKIYATLNLIYTTVGKKLGLRYNPMAFVDRPKNRKSLEEMQDDADDEVLTNDDPKAPGKASTLRAVEPDEVSSADESAKLIMASHAGVERVRHLLAVSTGLRSGELNGLQWNQIDLDAGEIHVRRSLTEISDRHVTGKKGKTVFLLEKPKNQNALRTVPIGKLAVAELKRWKLKCPKSKWNLVLPNELGQPATRKTVWRALRAAAERAKITPISINNLRHTYASQMLLSGRDPLEVAKLMGHSSVTVTLTVYARWCNRERSGAADALEARLFGKKKR
jgi:integrase